MKNIVSFFVLLFLFLLPSGFNQEELKCSSTILQYYGLEGMSSSIPYYKVEKVNSENFCPNLKETCCTAEDYDLTREMWRKNSKNLKRYLTQMFRIIQKITIIQSSLIQFMTKIQSKDTPTCKRIDSTFLNSPIKYDDVYFYIRNAFEAFAYLQKGFYCMICDPNAHRKFESKINYGRFFVEISENSCQDIIFFFREYLGYKVFFLDPLFKTMAQIINCVQDTNEVFFDNSHVASYQAVTDCLENKNYCYKVCKEFRMGISSNLFIGKLPQFQKLLKKMQEVMKELTLEEDPLNELDLITEEIPNEFFFPRNDTIVVNNMNILKDSNLSKAEVLFSNKGLDIFQIAINSNYFMVTEMNLDQIQKNFNIGATSEDTILSPTVSKPPEEFTEVPDLNNNRPNVEEIDALLKKMKSPEEEFLRGAEKLNQSPEGFEGTPGVDELEKEFADKMKDDFKLTPEEKKRMEQTNNSNAKTDSGLLGNFKPNFAF